MEGDQKVKDVAEAVRGIVEAVPVYQDAVRPVAKEIGRALGTIGKAINLALEPIAGAVWGWERIKEFVLKRLSEKLRDVPNDFIQSPDPLVAGPTLEALRWAGNNENLRELYANLLATSLDSRRAIEAHPSFVGIIRDMSSDEAKIIRFFSKVLAVPLIDWLVNTPGSGFELARANFSSVGQDAGCTFPELTGSYLDNLRRLGLIEIPEDVYFNTPGTYEALEKDAQVEAFRKELASSTAQANLSLERKIARLTAFGKLFCTSCVIERFALPAPD
jgi:Abortive infection alpha